MRSFSDLPTVGEQAPDLTRSQVYRDAIVFTVADPEGVYDVVERFTRGEMPTGLLGAILEYVHHHRQSGAALTPLYPERALGLINPSRDTPHDATGFQVALPDRRSRRQELSSYHYLRLASPEHSTLFASFRAKAVERESLVPEFYQPPLPLDGRVAPAPAFAPTNPEWAINHCGFPAIWPILDVGADPGPIGIIDEGGYVRHRALDGRVTEFPPEGTPADVIHASQIAAVISARRDNGSGMNGCCSAHIHLYNVSTSSGFNPKAFYIALKAVARDRLPVVNVSMFTPRDPLVERQIEELIEGGTIVVAAMGNSGVVEQIYPAAYENVIAVGATDVTHGWFEYSTKGTHIWLSAPGHLINTITSSTETGTHGNDGTSFAAAMVSAAAWLALRRQPKMSVSAMRDLLRKSVTKLDLHFEEMGHGELNMHELLKHLPAQA
jgi:hypothetical protein